MFRETELLEVSHCYHGSAGKKGLHVSKRSESRARDITLWVVNFLCGRDSPTPEQIGKVQVSVGSIVRDDDSWRTTAMIFSLPKSLLLSLSLPPSTYRCVPGPDLSIAPDLMYLGMFIQTLSGKGYTACPAGWLRDGHGTELHYTCHLCHKT